MDEIKLKELLRKYLKPLDENSIYGFEKDLENVFND